MDDPVKDESTLSKSNQKIARPLIGPVLCKGPTFIRYEGAFNEEKLPHGPGKMIGEETIFTSKDKYCYDLLPKIESIRGTFVNGQLHGPAWINYTHLATLEVTFEHGVIQGAILKC